MTRTAPVGATPTARSMGPAHTDVLHTTTEYAAAQELVDRLSDRGFPVEHAAIVATDLRMVEDVTGRKRYGRAALEGASSGALVGLLIGLFLSAFTLWEMVVSWVGVLASWTVLGAVVGAVLGVMTHAMRRGRRDFSSDARLVPGRYDVVVATDHAAEARRIGDLPAAPQTTERGSTGVS